VILDSSAIVAIFLDDPDRPRVEAALVEGKAMGIGTPTIVETGIVLSARMRLDARALLTRFLTRWEITEVPFLSGHHDEAVRAWLRFGKGRHPAALNLGDCFSYATARLAGRPLLCVGDDFPRTDLPLVLRPSTPPSS
jgi:ribonuclease VapC